MKLGPILARLQELETELADGYRAIGERHAVDHDVYHQCQSFAMQCDRHARALEPHVARYGEAVDTGGADLWSGLLEPARLTSSEPLGRVPQGGLLLLRDLRVPFLAAEETSITWVMVGQAAQAARDQELLETVTQCHTETESCT